MISREELSASLLRDKLGDLRSPWDLPLIPDFLKGPSDDDEEFEEGLGLTLPATPLDDSSPSDSEVDPELLNPEEDEEEYDFCLPQLTHATEQVEELARKVWAAGW